jgi:hypothetical protein
VTDSKPLYPKHRPWDLEPHYSRHVSAMTAEQLHSKADIAEQLAWRDQLIESLRSRLAEYECPDCGEERGLGAYECCYSMMEEP